MAKDKNEGKAYSLDYMPSDQKLLGFGSLEPPPPPKKPSLIGRLLTLPFRIVLWPFKLVVRILTWPFRRSGAPAAD